MDELNNCDLGATIGTIQIAALGFADEIVLISDNPEKLQRRLDICQSWTSKDKMSFNTSKCKVMVFHGSRNKTVFKLYGEKLDIAESYKYLGITLTSKNVTNLSDYILPPF